MHTDIRFLFFPVESSHTMAKSHKSRGSDWSFFITKHGACVHRPTSYYNNVHVIKHTSITNEKVKSDSVNAFLWQSPWRFSEEQKVQITQVSTKIVRLSIILFQTWTKDHCLMHGWGSGVQYYIHQFSQRYTYSLEVIRIVCGFQKDGINEKP